MPNFAEPRFCELRIDGVLGSSEKHLHPYSFQPSQIPYRGRDKRMMSL